MTTIQTYNWPTVPFGAYKGVRVSWAAIEKSRGSYDWSRLDSIVSLAQSKSVDLMYTFVDVPQWASSNKTQWCYRGYVGCAAPPSSWTYWEEFVGQLVTRYKGKIKFYELWNEPNDLNFWSGNVTQMVEMNRRAANLIRGIDPNARLLSPAPTWSKTTAWYWFDLYFAAGGNNYFDVVSYHAYTGTTKAESIFTIVDNVKKVMNTYGVYKPMWITEGGWGRNSVVSDYDAQAGFLAQRALLTWWRGVQRVYWYQWDNQEWGTLWNSSTGIRKAGRAYGEVYKWMVGSTLTSCSQASDYTWTCYLGRSDGSKAKAVWNPAGSKSYTPGSEYTQYRDLAGNLVKMSGSSTTIGYKPILFESATSSSGSTGSTDCTYTGMAQPSVKVCTPTQGATVSSPVQVKALAADKNSIKTLQVYVDGVLVHTKHNSASLDVSLSMSSGTRNIKVQAKNSLGQYFSASVSVSVGSSASTGSTSPTTAECSYTGMPQPSVKICSPAQGSSWGSSVRVTALAADSNPIVLMEVYLDGKLVYSTSYSAKVDTTMTLGKGTRTIKVQAKNSLGKYFSSSVTFTVQ